MSATVPNVVGQQLGQALAMLQSAGVLVPSALGYFGVYPITVVWEAATINRGMVMAQSPPSATMVAPNSPITLTVNDYVPAVIFP
jgi:beta-lactam-binding protein with PASTA domain